MKKYKEMTGHEKIAFKNVRGIFNWEVGGWFNCWQDDDPEYIPDTVKEAKEIIYCESMVDRAEPGHYSCGRAPVEMRFAGEAFIREVIDYLFSKDEDVKVVAEFVGWDM